MTTLRLACEAMATRFEFVLVGDHPTSIRAAGEEALAEIHRLESVLSLYRPDSEIAELNRSAAEAMVRVSPEVFGLLSHACLLSRATEGAFDITVGPLMRAWGFLRSPGRMPDPAELEEARRSVSSDWIAFDETRCGVRFLRPGMMIDLGAIGKGYALDRAGEVLRHAGVENYLLHGGTSTTVARGQPPDTDVWRVVIDSPAESRPDPDGQPVAVVELHDESVSVSAVRGKGFQAGDRFYGHVIDPRRGEPVRGAQLAAMVLPSGAESDALSTALLVRGSEMVRLLDAREAPARCLVLEQAPDDPGGFVVTSRGIAAPRR